MEPMDTPERAATAANSFAGIDVSKAALDVDCVSVEPAQTPQIPKTCAAPCSRPSSWWSMRGRLGSQCVLVHHVPLAVHQQRREERYHG